MVALDISVTAHLLVVAVVNVAIVPVSALRGFMPRAEAEVAGPAPLSRSGATR